MAQTPPPLFREIAPPALAKIASAEFAKRESYVAIDWRSLYNPVSKTQGQNSPEAIAKLLNLNLLPDARFVAERTRLTWYSADRFTWVGRIGQDVVVLAVNKEAIHGSIQVGERVFEIESLAGGSHRILEMDQDRYLQDELDNPEACGDQEAAAEDLGGFLDDAPPASDKENIVIDVMVVYEKAAADKISNMDVYVANLIELSNEIYKNSDIPQTVRLVHHQLVNSGINGRGNLSWLGKDEEIKRLRDKYGADLVAMILETHDACGTAGGGGTSITKRSCAVGNKTFTHELGHNMGAKHAWEQFNNPSGYNYGYINHTKSWRTVMSYAKCDNGGRCTRLGYFSNPDVKYNGDPTGIKDSRDNARMIRSRSLAISKYRDSKIDIPVAVHIEDGPRLTSGYAFRGLSPTSAEFSLAKDQNLEIFLVSLNGRKTPIASRHFTAGEVRVEWNHESLAPGLHFLNIRGEKDFSVSKIPMMNPAY